LDLHVLPQCYVHFHFFRFSFFLFGCVSKPIESELGHRDFWICLSSSTWPVKKYDGLWLAGHNDWPMWWHYLHFTLSKISWLGVGMEK
jgi:hypothetical protein